MLHIVADEQIHRCAAPMVTCEEIEDGKPTSLCPWGDRPVPLACQELDHIIPYCQTQDDSRANLNMLCRCCHGLKTDAERRAGWAP